MPCAVPGPLDGDARLLESLFEADVTSGIGDTGFRAAVLKIVTDEPGMTPDVERLANAVANVHLRTGVPICTHANARTKRGLDQQELLKKKGVDLGRVVIGHCNETTDLDYLTRVLDNGSYVGWDRCGIPLAVPLDKQIDTLTTLCERGYANRITLGHDEGSFFDWFTNAEVDPVAPGLALHLHPRQAPAQPPGPRRHRRPDQPDARRQPARLLQRSRNLTPSLTRRRLAEDGEVVGIITPSDLTRWLRRWRTLDGRALDGRRQPEPEQAVPEDDCFARHGLGGFRAGHRQP